ncbi:MAG TPA: hypothetical protein PLX24_00005, partial [Bacteroidales bacterium]|nr:hypothetical protein [Bacteroidales bacterium]
LRLFYQCLLFQFLIKPQLHIINEYMRNKCLLFQFLIKPQQRRGWLRLFYQCLLFQFLIKPQLMPLSLR